jgi:ubiquitin-like 1-activating enzyme E1 B
MLELKAGVKDGEAAAPILAFDKDDEDTLDFVTASANLRSLIFGIDIKSKFDIKRKYRGISTSVGYGC